MPHTFTFKKSERLCGERDFETLLASARSTSVTPLKVVWKEQPRGGEPTTMKVAISVPKRCFKKAVDRNILKRRIRESYRKHKFELHSALQQRGLSARLLIVYTRKEILGQGYIEEKLIHSLRNIENELARRYPLVENTAVAGQDAVASVD